MRRSLVIGNVLAVTLVIAYGIVEYAAPVAAAIYWDADYKRLMFKCDQAMRGHLIAKRAVVVSPNSTNVRNLQAAEVGLVDCHFYDKLRKKLLVYGVSEAKLSSIGLEALEEKAYELRRFVDIHEIRY